MRFYRACDLRKPLMSRRCNGRPNRSPTYCIFFAHLELHFGLTSDAVVKERTYYYWLNVACCSHCSCICHIRLFTVEIRSRR